MLNKENLKLKAISNKLLSLVSGGTGLIENIRVGRKKEDREKYRRGKKKASEARRHRY